MPVHAGGPAGRRRPSDSTSCSSPLAAGLCMAPVRCAESLLSVPASCAKRAPALAASTATPGSSSGAAQEDLPPHRPDAEPAERAPVGAAVAPQVRHATAGPQSAAHAVDTLQGATWKFQLHMPREMLPS